MRNFAIIYRSIHSTVNLQQNILFFGTDQFALTSLKKLHFERSNGNLIKTLQVVTTKAHSVVGKYAVNKNIPLHCWRDNLALNRGDFHVGIVVSFGHLIPNVIIDKFTYGMINVHASLLPRWRGAAPIIYAIANGDTETGVTIMQIRAKKFDVGAILLQNKCPLSPTIKMPELTEQLAQMGADMLVKTVSDLPGYLRQAREQPDDGVSYAPRITAEFGRVHWLAMTSREIYDKFRAVYSVYPLLTTWHGLVVKIFECHLSDGADVEKNDFEPGYVTYDRSVRQLWVQCVDGHKLVVTKLSVAGKKPMSGTDFYNGFMTKCDRHVFS